MFSVLRNIYDLQIILIPPLSCLSRCLQRGNKTVEGRDKIDVTQKKKNRGKKNSSKSFLSQPHMITVFISLYLNEEFQLIKSDTGRAQNNRAAKGF